MKTSSFNWHGKLEITYQNRDNQTQILSNYSQAPFKIQSPFYPEGKNICHSIILHTAGGMVGSDILSQKITLNDNCKTLITTPSAAKIYKTNGKIATSNILIKIHDNACLEFLPQENIIFNGAVYQQNYRVELGENSHYFHWEINRFGRTARGEKFTQGDWKSATEIWQKDQFLFGDRQWLPGNEQICNNINGLAGQSIIGTLYLIGELPNYDHIKKQIRSLWNHRKTQGEAGVTHLIKGILCRYRGNSMDEVKTWFIDVWDILRLHYLDRHKTIPRVWQIKN